MTSLPALRPTTLASTLLLASVMSLSACSRPNEPPAAATPAPAHSAAAAPAATWTLDAEASRLSFVSIKNNAMAEVHRFTELSGAVNAQGEASLKIGLESVNTGIEIRDQRMREMLFEAASYPQATVALSVDPQTLNALAPGASQTITTEARLDLHGLSGTVAAEIRVTRVDAQRWLVTSEQPVIVDAASFDLIAGIEKLREVAGLQAIGLGVPVSFTLSFIGS